MEPDPKDVRQVFYQTLSTLSSSKTAINAACQQAMGFQRHNVLIFDLIKDLIQDEKTSADKRMSLLYLVDSLCHYGNKSNNRAYTELVESHMTRLLPIFKKTENEKTLKVISTWKSKGFFSVEQFREWEMVVGEMITPSKYRDDDSSGRSIHRSMTSGDIMRRMEEDREKQKRQREETASRPSNESEDAEFLEWWDASADLSNNYHRIIPAPLIEFSEFPIKRVKLDIEKQPPPEKKKRVLIWDLDETLIIFQSLLNTSFAQKFGKTSSPERAQEAKSLGLRMEGLIFAILDESFFFKTLETIDASTIDAFASEDDGENLENYDFKDGLQKNFKPKPREMKKVAYRFRRIRDLYNTPRILEKILNEKQLADWKKIYDDINKFAENWLEFAANILSASVLQNEYTTTNYMVTSTHLVPVFAKLLLFKIDEFFPAGNVMSSSPKGKLWCFQQIKAKIPPDASVLVIGDSLEEQQAAAKMKWDFFLIHNKADLHDLYNKHFDEGE